MIIETERLVTTDELADLLSVDCNTVYCLAKAGKIPMYKVGRCVRFDAQAVKQALARRVNEQST